MKRWKLVTMACTLLASQLLQAGTALHDFDSRNPFWWMRGAVLAAIVVSVSFSVLLVWFSAVSRDRHLSRESAIPEASVNEEDPFFVWCVTNQALLSQYQDMHLAISPTRGIIALGRTDEDFEASLVLAGELPDDTVLTHSAMFSGGIGAFVVH
jgi:hypothetical protein